MKPRTLLQGLAGLAAWGCLSGLALVRLCRAVRPRARPGHSGRRRGAGRPGGGGGAAAPADPPPAAPVRPHLEDRPAGWGGLFPWALLDTSYDLFSAGDMAIGRLPFRLVCALGSGLVLAGVVLALATAARRFGRLELPAGEPCCCWPWR